MRTLKIYKSALPTDNRYRYLENDMGRLDILGQILTQLGYNCEGNHMVPSDLGKEIPLFVRRIRTRLVDTPLTQALLDLDIHPPRERPGRAAEILKPYFNVEILP